MKLKIACTPWHVMHYWDLMNALKDDADFFLMANTWRSWRDERFLNTRPIPENVTFVPFYEEGKYDFCILGIDQQALQPEMGKSKVYREFNSRIQDIPKVVINHGSPIHPDFFKHDAMTDEDAKAACRAEMRAWIGENHMVVNSFKAADEWGWGYPIWHGLDANEWMPEEKEPRVCTALSPGGLDIYYNRQCMNEMMQILEKQFGYELQWARVTRFADTAGNLVKYKRLLARSLLYVDTSVHTPMNRARTEAMLSGCCIVQVHGAHDLERFARDQENIVLVKNNPESLAIAIMGLLKAPGRAKRIGAEGRETAKKLFNRDRYRQDWLKYIHEIVLK